MVKKNKTSIKSKIGFVICIVALLVVMYFVVSAVAQKIGSDTEQRQLIESIKTSVDKFEKVYSSINLAYPSPQLSEYNRSCGRLSDVMQNGPIVCGSDFTIVTAQDASGADVTLRNTFSNNSFEIKEVNKSSSRYQSPSVHYELKYNNDTQCSVDSIAYDEMNFLRYYSNLKYDQTHRVIKGSCSSAKTVNDYIPGFDKSK